MSTYQRDAMIGSKLAGIGKDSYFEKKAEITADLQGPYALSQEYSS